MAWGRTDTPVRGATTATARRLRATATRAGTAADPAPATAAVTAEHPAQVTAAVTAEHPAQATAEHPEQAMATVTVEHPAQATAEHPEQATAADPARRPGARPTAVGTATTGTHSRNVRSAGTGLEEPDPDQLRAPPRPWIRSRSCSGGCSMIWEKRTTVTVSSIDTLRP
jgi:hypothetical protein